MLAAAPIADVAVDNMPKAPFEMLQQLPFSVIASGSAALLIVTCRSSAG